METNSIITIVGYVLFFLSDLMTFLPTPSNGILQTIIMILRSGVGSALKPLPKDIEMAQSLITDDKKFANIINKLNASPQVQQIVENMLLHPNSVSNLLNVQTNPSVRKVVEFLQNNHQAQLLFNNIISNQQLFNDLTITTFSSLKSESENLVN